MENFKFYNIHLIGIPEKKRCNISCNNDWEIFKMNDRCQTTDSGISENTEQDNNKEKKFKSIGHSNISYSNLR